MKALRLVVATLVLLTQHAHAQSYIVDINNGPGTSFTSIATAVAAVPDGAVLFVRAGTYGPFEIVAKSLTVIGGLGVLVEGSAGPTIRIADLTANQAVSLRRLAWTRTLYPGRLDCEDCAGTILVDACIVDLTVHPLAGVIRARSCDRIFVRQSRIRPGLISYPTIDVEHTNITLTDCRLNNPLGVVKQTGGLVHLSDCVVEHSGFGANGLIEQQSGDLVISGNCLLKGSSRPNSPLIRAIDGNGIATVDPNTALQRVTAQPYAPGITTVSRAIPRLDAATQGGGGNATATLLVPGGSTGALYLGFTATPYYVAAVTDAIWLAQPAIHHAIGGSPSVTGTYVVPNATWVRGVQITWQGVTLDPTGSLALSNPNSYVHF